MPWIAPRIRTSPGRPVAQPANPCFLIGDHNKFGPLIREDSMKRAITLIAVFGAVTAALTAAEVGKAAPEFTATDIKGQTHKLSDYSGKIVVLESYNLDCPYLP